MASDWKSQLDWIRGLTGDDKVKVGSVVSWQATAVTLNEIVKHFNVITFGSNEADSQRCREVQLKKIVVGLLYEMDACLDFWANELQKAHLLDQDIVDTKKEFKTACKKVGLDVLKQVRNGVAFHYTDYLTDPEAIVSTYERVDQITLDSINEILYAANACGYAMRDKVVESMG